MLIPIITGYGSDAVRADTMQLVGTGFGRVSSVALLDGSGNQYECDFQVDTGQSIHLTIPRLIPEGTYTPVIGTLDNATSQNLAGPITLPVLVDSTPAARVDPEPVPNPASPACVAIRSRARLEYGDFETSFQAVAQGDGFTRRFELPAEVISPDTVTVTIQAETDTGYGPASVVAADDFDLEASVGVITFGTAPENDSKIVVTGKNHQFFTDDEVNTFIRSAALKHTHSAEDLLVYRDINGFKRFLYTDETVDTIAPVEHHVVAILAAIEALEVIRSDATFDINTVTSDGTSLPREDRFRNLGELIATKQARYDYLCNQLGVGLGRIEVFTLRRVSRTTGKLVPVYVDREYDDVRTPPLRVFAPRNLGITGGAFDQPDPRAYYGSGGP